MTEHNCPVDGCEFEGELGSVRGHINASSDPEHDRSELKALVEQQGSPDEPEDQGEAGEEQPEATESEGNDHPEEGGETNSAEEYGEQWESTVSETTP